MAKLIADNLDFCEDCLMGACNGDFSGMSDARATEVRAGLDRVSAEHEGGYIVPSFDSETGEGIADFSWVKCDCCLSTLGGSRHKFGVIK